ncbi:MAG: glycosyltransferase family 4 protein [Candidatus Goldbacteria bacterium]|nr:glycosyltransferase family 4 protein [Candidatus Goldiibacteriota bacterium]
MTQKITGSQRFAIEISKQLRKLQPERFVFVAPKNVIHWDIAKELDVKIVGINTGHLWEQIDLPLYLKKQGNPLIINLVNTAPLFYLNKIVTIHDVSMHRFPKQYSFLFLFWYKINYYFNTKFSLIIFTVSNFSKNELMYFYKIKPNKIFVINNAVDHVKFNKLYKNEREDYILSVSSLSINKNFYSVIKAINILKKKKLNIKYKIIGTFNEKLFSNKGVELNNTNNNIEYLGYLPDDKMFETYSNALLFIYPSFYEGFGIPPLEAMACGCPCVVSNTASLPEVCGDAAYYVNPYDVEDIARGIEKVLTDENLREELIKKGFENIKRFSWEKSARKVIEVLDNLSIDS